MEEIAKWHLKTVKEDFKKKQLPAEHEQKQLVEYKKQREIEEK
jgi:CRISPR/Cas system-associated protein Cas7 (RAMP superfamily)